MMKLRPTLLSLLLALTAFSAANASVIIIDDPSSGSSQPRAQMDESLAQNGAVRNAKELFSETSDEPVAGNPQGKVTLVEFFDFRCPHCDRMAPIIESLIANNPDLRVVYKTFPILGNKSVFAAEAAYASIPQGKYLAFHKALMQTGHAIDFENVYTLAKEQGIDITKLKTDMGSGKIDYHLENNKKLGQSLGIIGTPAFFIAKTNLSTNANPESVGFAGGEVEQSYLQTLINKASK
jgi:protein-disulfide isomerase